MTAEPVNRAIGRNALFLIFTLSGFSGLIYESIWSHYLKLFLGHAAYAQTLVLTVFMGGMAAGAWLAARLSPRLRNLLAAYAIVEVVTGAIALAFHQLYVGSVGFTFDHVIPALDSAIAINTVKWLIATLLILPQSVLLGATFPLISGGTVRRFPGSAGATLAMLYFTNSLGAALGVLASGFWLIGLVGLPGTVMIAGLINVGLGLTVWLLRGAEPPAGVASPDAPADPQSNDAVAAFTRQMLLVAFLSGVAAFIYEIAWIRMLSLVLGSSTHAFELMLSAFILGLAFGGLVIRRYIDSLGNLVRTLAVMFAVMAALGALSLPAYGLTFDVISAAMRGFAGSESGYVGFNFVSHGVAAAIMIPTTFVAGMTLPVITHALLKRADERAIGRVYAANTVGAIVGVLGTVHLLLPAVGLKGAVLAGAIVQLAIAFILAPRPFAAGTPRVLHGAFAGGAAVLLLVGFLVTLDPMRMASGVYRKGMARLPDEAKVISLRDGKTATISLAKLGDTVIIATNGKPDAAINMGPPGTPSPDEMTVTMAAALPLALHARPREVANIGIGSGLTSSIALATNRIERLDTIEIEPVMAESARLGFGDRVARVFDDPRSHIHFEDAKTFFSAAKRRYDVIISEPSNPWVSGVATLFSDEFYAQIRHYVKDDGLLVQWIQIYETDTGIVASVVKALTPHFDDYVVYCTDDANILIVARPRGKVPALGRDLFTDAGLATELRLAGLGSMGDIEIRRIGDRQLLGPLFASFPVPANSDFHPYVDLNAPRLRFLSRDALDLVRLSHLPVPLPEIFGQPLTMPSSDSVASARYFLRHRRAIEARAAMRAFADGNLDAAPEDLRTSLGTLRANAACADDDAHHAWLDAVHTLAARTTPFLPPAERAPLWKALNGANCLASLSPPERNWFDLLAAIGSHDNPKIAEHGRQFFETPPPRLTGEELLEALLATVAAGIATDHGAAARATLEGFLPALQSAGDFTLALRLTEAKARDSH